MKIPEQISREIKLSGGIDKIIEKLPDENRIVKQSLIYDALSSPLRLKILSLLSIQPLCACIIQKITKTSPSKLSYHLSILTNNNLIEGKKEASWITYSITELGQKYVFPNL
ncbi:MAG: metalloregulator ArsR/SmtB family transcription factor [Methanolobus sp.]|uniref:ArsR/SmtB family transcription factor n=1 Tax=Methanolobus sp. TaxID=1874737 RepID=UPI0027322063|nr:metalloregulator ArsR/SmtB family transcription factor [Methanolobus sp.]MDP2218077.1 metalloregulator ArsR/SmtB family transcription factor [Methanolobus sp.]